MKALLLLVMIGFSTPAWADEKQQQAEQAAELWLSQLDAGEYQATWENAASLFKGQITAAQWRQAASAARQPLGVLITRKLINGTYATSLPGAPDGEYVVLQFQTAFANKAQAIETVTPMLDRGEWRVSGYFVK